MPLTIRFRRIIKIGLYRMIMRIACTGFMSIVSTERKLTAVSPLNGYERFYTDTKKLNDLKETRQWKTDETEQKKIDICADILASPLFKDIHYIDMVLDPQNQATYAELMQNYPKFYKDFDEPKNFSKDFRLVNSYRLRDVAVAQDVAREAVFPCVARNRKTRKIVEYFISAEYALNTDGSLDDDDGAGQFKGRFVFAYNEGEKLVVSALAEEPTSTLLPQDVTHELFRFNTSQEGISYGSEEKTSTICALSIFQKIRLCVLALSAEKYRKVKFLPRKENIDPECLLRKIDIDCQKDYACYSLHVSSQEDWVIGCNALQVDDNEPIKFDLSRGLRDMDYFICRRSGSEGGDVTLVSGLVERINPYPGTWRIHRM